MKTTALIPALLSISTAGTLAGTIAIDPAPAQPVAGGFDTARRPITNPTLFDSALPTTNIHPIFMYHRLPSYVNTTIGQVPMDDHVEVYALQLELALSERPLPPCPEPHQLHDRDEKQRNGVAPAARPPRNPAR